MQCGKPPGSIELVEIRVLSHRLTSHAVALAKAERQRPEPGPGRPTGLIHGPLSPGSNTSLHALVAAATTHLKIGEHQKLFHTINHYATGETSLPDFVELPIKRSPFLGPQSGTTSC